MSIKYSIAAAIVVFHVVLIGFLMKNRQAEEKPQKATPAQQKPWTPATGADKLPPLPPPEKAPPKYPGNAVSPMPGATMAPASHGGKLQWANDLRQLPPKLQQLSADCRTGILVDWNNGRVLWNKDPDRPVPIASLTKMLVALVLMETVQADPAVTMQTMVQVTREAYLIGGSQAYLDPRESFSLDDLLKCIMVFSANDAAQLLAQYLGGGDVAAGVSRLNQRAAELGLGSVRIINPHGLPNNDRTDENVGSAKDMAALAGMLLEYPEVVKWSSTRLTYLRENTPKPYQMVNRNKLITECPGVNGMKTGYTDKARYCVAATCVRDSRILVAVVTGVETSAKRNALVSELLNWGYSIYTAK